jgi:environmental stress-induced protein Ves
MGGPFSVFRGVDRTIMLLEGDGVRLQSADFDHVLDAPHQPFAFDGDAAVECHLLGGLSTDFNLMVRRAQARGEVQVWSRPTTRKTDPATVLVFCARGVIDTADGRLHAGDAWRPLPHSIDPVTLRDGALALVVRIVPHTR